MDLFKTDSYNIHSHNAFKNNKFIIMVIKMKKQEYEADSQRIILGHSEIKKKDNKTSE